MEKDSDMRPRYAEEAEKRGVGDRLRFIQPPPVALLLTPLGYLSYQGAFKLWTLLLVACGWGVAVQAGKIHDLLYGQATKASGLLVLLIACSPLMLHAIRVANMSVGVALLIGLTLFSMIRPHNALGGVAAVLGAITKYATIPLLALMLIMRRWKLLIASIVFGGLLLAASFALMKAGPFKTYYHEIAPTLTRTHDIETNQSITAFLGRILHTQELPKNVRWGVLAVQGLTLAGLLWLLVSKSQLYWQNPGHVLAASMALLTYMLIFSPVFWEHYPVYLCPLWGWLLYEGRQRPGMGAVAFLAVALTYIPLTAWMDLREPLNTHILPSAILMFGLAVWVLVRPVRLVTSRPQSEHRL